MQSAARGDASLRMRSTYVSAGGCSDLESLKSGKDRTKPWAFSLLMHSERTTADLHRELSRLPIHFRADLALSGPLLFVIFRSLLLADLIATVTADSDLTSLQKETP